MRRGDASVHWREYVDALVRELRAYVDALFRSLKDTVSAHEAEMNRREHIHMDAHRREHKMTEDSIDRARRAMDERVKNGENARGVIASDLATMMPRTEADAAVAGLRREFEAVVRSIRSDIAKDKEARDEREQQTDKYMQRAIGIVLLVGFVMPIVLFVMARAA